ncbi:protein SAR DEFICIENT 1 [Silene latifolia]|uniref:protein SAR DEFICIENT 1 n=1 Tax=Silene latifolia TaxID=37657 RepID=UPI003D770F97
MAAAKRIASSSAENDDDHQLRGKRPRSIPSFASVIGEVMLVRSFQGLCDSLEPLIRRVVNEEVERGIQRSMRTITRSPSLRIQAREPASLRLIFTNTTLPMIFTCNTILDNNGQQLQLMLVEKIGDQITPKTLPYPIKIELVAIEGDFPSPIDRDTWTPAEFNKKVVRERNGRRPLLLSKEVNYSMKNTSYLSVGDVEFTDNSSWIRSRKFKVGARVVVESCNGVRILEAVTDAFVVKDHRGVSYQKHYPPKLNDDVWRLEKIGKDGTFHKRLRNAGIFTVQDFLKLSVVDPQKLKLIIGERTGITERMWDTILKHAKTCEIGNKLYITRGSNFTLILDAICQTVSVKSDAQHSQDITACLKGEVDQLVKNAYENWNSLEVVERPVDTILQQAQAIAMAECNNSDLMQYEVVFGGIIEVDSNTQAINQNDEIGFGDWETSDHIFN